MARGQSKLDEALGTHVVLDSTNIPANIIVETDIGDNAIGNDQMANNAIDSAEIVTGAVDNAHLANSTIEAGKIDFFKSGTLTGTGTAQSTAHSLGRTPTLVLVLMQEGGVTGAVTEGVHDGTNCIVTVASGMDYKIVAL
jgi:hypothetical protein